jgi:putative transposase
MPTKRPILANNEIYHVVLRGIDGRKIFEQETDYYRMIHDIFEFNDIKPAGWRHRRFNVRETVPRIKSEDRPRTIKYKRTFIVNILAFCWMPNHIHLLLKQVKENGITNFMRKLGTGYAVYFNQKYERQGHLFQGRFKAVHIKTNEQLQSVFVYIHTNPVALVAEKWKEGGIDDTDRIIECIENYKWSSYQDYLGKENFPSVTQRELFNQTMSKEKWREYVNDWVRHKSERVSDKSVELE